MKEFNLERALAGDPVITEEGLKAEVLKKFTYGGSSERLAVLITDIHGGQHLREYFIDATPMAYAQGMGCLVMAPKKVKCWYNLYKDGAGAFYESEHDARASMGARSYLETRSIEWEE